LADCICLRLARLLRDRLVELEQQDAAKNLCHK
jgi:hypothetical protein